MSGGAFDYKQSIISDIADEIEQEIIQVGRKIPIEETKYPNGKFTFKKQNVRWDEAVFSFEPSKDDPINRIVTMPDGTKLLRFAAVFGANASGKSNFLSVLDFLLSFFTHQSYQEMRKLIDWVLQNDGIAVCVYDADITLTNPE